MDVVNHLLAHQLSTNDALLHNLPHLKQLLAQRIIQQAEQEEGLNGPVLHRWNLRLASLVAPTVLAPLRTAGFELLHLTFSASTSSLLSQGKNTIALALNVIASNKSDPAIFVAALELVRLILAKSTWHAAWAREVAGAAVVQRTVNALVAAANGQVEEVKRACLNAIVSLLPLFPTPLRPLAPSLHTLAIALISQPGASRANIDAGSQLFVSLYLLAPKGRDGLRDAWKKGAEALVGSIDSLVPVITTDIFAEDPLTNHTLAPLALPPLVDNSPIAALVRIEALSQALALLLRTPTVERVGAVEVPVGALVELGVRLVGLNTETPIKERVDPSTITLSLSLLPRLQLIGCQLLAQLGLAVGTPLVSHATEILGTISRTLSTYALRSPMRASLSTTYSLILTSLGASLDPEEGKKSLARVWRCVLEDISAVAVEPVAVAASAEDGKGGRKNKKQKTTYDPSESFEKKRAAVEEMDLAIAERALATLKRLLLAPASHFLPPKLQLSTSRLLLFLALDPSFFSTHPLPSTSTSTFFPATSASSGVDVAKQSVVFRRGVVKALRALAEQGGNAVGGTLERAAEVWSRGCLDGDEEIKHLSTTALSSLSSLIHPLLPPQQVNTTFARLKAERVGGFSGVGDDQDLEEGAREFAARVAKRGRGEGMEVDDEEEEDEEDEEVKRSLVAQTKATSISSSRSGAGQDGQGEKMIIEEQVTVVKPTTASSFGTAAGFASFAAVKQVEAVAPAPAAVEEDEEDSSDEEAEVPTFVEAVLPSVATGGASRGGDDDEDSSDDEAMPTIHMDSDEE